MHRNDFQSAAPLAIALMAVVALLAGCDGAEQNGADVAVNQPQVVQPAGAQQPLGQVKEFDDFTLRANISPTEFLPETMARAYAITAAPNLVLLNLVVLEKRSDGQAVPVSAALSAHYENLVGQVKVIDMRVVEANGNVSYIGTLDASAERVFRLVIEAQPAGTNQPLQMNFDVQLDKLDIR